MNKLIWKGAFLDPSGYGEASRGYLKGVAAVAGDALQIRVKPQYFWGGTSIGKPDCWDLLKKYHGSDFDRLDAHILLQHLTPDLWRVGYGRAYHVGMTTFETDQLPYNWKMNMRGMDELWTFSKWAKDVFEEERIGRPVYVMPHGVDCQRFHPGADPLVCLARGAAPYVSDNPIGSDTFVFGANFDWTERKNPKALIRAYFTAFRPDEDVVLALKCYHQYPISRSRDYIKSQIDSIRNELQLNKTPTILLISDILPDHLVPNFYASLDAYVLPSRGEGWGLTYSEAMASGLPVIGTNWSGNTEFMNGRNSYLLYDIKLKDITAADAGAQRQYVGHKWADINLEELRHAMRRVYEDRDAAKKVGAIAREDMVKKFSWPAAGQKIWSRIQEIK